jgi:NAD(P)H-dependent FMN reductase
MRYPRLPAPGMTEIPKKKLLILAASNGENLKLARRCSDTAEELGASPAILDLTTAGLPLFTPQAQAAGHPPALLTLAQQMEEASCWLICAPEYNASIPPVLSNAIAWLSVHSDDFRALFDSRPIALATYSGSGGTAVLAAMRLQLVYLGANVVGRQLIGNESRPVRGETIVDVLTRLLKLAHSC